MDLAARQRPGDSAVHNPLIDVKVTAAGWTVGIVVTVLAIAMPWFLVGVHSHTAHLVLDTADACVALLAAYLLWGRFVRAGRLSDLLLVQALVMLAIAGLGLSFLTSLVLEVPRGTVDAWVPIVLRLTAAALLAFASLPRADKTPTRTEARCWILLSWATVGVLGMVVWFARDVMPAVVDPFPQATDSLSAAISGHPLLAVTHTVTGLLQLAASVGFTFKAMRRRDELVRWLGPALALGGFARFNYAMNPTLYTDWLYAGDVLRTAFHAVLLIGAIRELGQYWSGMAATTVLEDRRRVAQEVHDGVMQELAFIRAVTRDIPGHVSAATRIEEAATRALDEARAAVQHLRRLDPIALPEAVQRAAAEVAARHGLTLEADIDPTVETPVEQVHTLVRITREAVTNAAKHGMASTIRLALRTDGSMRVLSVADDGVGFEGARPETKGSGYGLVTMRERAEALPGTLEIESQPGIGSVVTVTW